MNNPAIFSPNSAEHYQEHKMTQHFFIAVLHIITCLAWEESYIITINPCSLLLSWHRHDGLNGRTQSIVLSWWRNWHRSLLSSFSCLTHTAPACVVMPCVQRVQPKGHGENWFAFLANAPERLRNKLQNDWGS